MAHRVRFVVAELGADVHPVVLHGNFGAHANLADRDALAEFLTPLHGVDWVDYSKRPFGGPEAVLAYLSRYTHRVAISNSRLLACDSTR